MIWKTQTDHCKARVQWFLNFTIFCKLKVNNLLNIIVKFPKMIPFMKQSYLGKVFPMKNNLICNNSHLCVCVVYLYMLMLSIKILCLNISWYTNSLSLSLDERERSFCGKMDHFSGQRSLSKEFSLSMENQGPLSFGSYKFWIWRVEFMKTLLNQYFSLCFIPPEVSLSEFNIYINNIFKQFSFHN